MKQFKRNLIIILTILSSVFFIIGTNSNFNSAFAVPVKYSKLNVPGFTIQPGSRDNSFGGAMVMYKADNANAKGRYAFVMVYVTKCYNCPPLNKSEWQKKKGNLMMMLSRATKNDPNLVFEIDEIRIAGKTAITVYSESYMKKERTTAAAYGLDLYYHNNKKQVKISVTSRAKSFGMAKSRQEMKENFTKQEMIDAAKKILAVYRNRL